jgi:uncharacterized membrane protein
MNRQDMAMQYLLGKLAEEEEAFLEERFFSEDGEFEELEIAEDELIDRYVRGQLSDEDSRRFRRLLISTRLAERVELARILAQRTSSRTQPEVVEEPEKNSVVPAQAPSWSQRVFGTATAASLAFRPAFAASIMLLLTTTALVFVWMKSRTESFRLAAEQQQREDLKRQIDDQQARFNALETAQKQTQSEKDELGKLVEQYRQQLEQQQQRQPAPFVLAFQLLPGTVRGGGDNRKPLTLHKGVSAVDLDLDVSPGEYPRYSAILQDKDGNTFSNCRNLIPSSRSGSKYIRCRVSAKLLSPGIYNVHVDGVPSTGSKEDFQDYPFRVVHR